MSSAAVTVDGEIAAEIGVGILALLGVEKGDDIRKAEMLADKIVNLRIFPDEAGKMNLSLKDAGGAVLVVSQFTLAGNCAKGRRPSFDTAAPSEEGKRLYEYFAESVRRLGVDVRTGIFQSDMQVSLVNDGPVTFVLEA